MAPLHCGSLVTDGRVASETVLIGQIGVTDFFFFFKKAILAENGKQPNYLLGHWPSFSSISFFTK